MTGTTTVTKARSAPAIADAFDAGTARGARARARETADAVLWPELKAVAGVGRVRRCGAYRMRIIERPARALGPDRAAALRSMCVRASSLSFGVDMTPYWHSRPEFFSEMSEWCVVERDGDLAGWHGIAVWQGDYGTVLYTDMLVTLPGHRSTGLGALLGHDAWLRIAARTRSLPIVACRTQNPIVMRMIKQFTTTAYPRPDGRPEGSLYEGAEQVARLVAEHKRPGTRPERGTFVARGASPCALCDRLPLCGDPRIDAFFAHLDVAAGDAVYAVGLTSPPGALRWIARHKALRTRVAISARSEGKESCDETVHRS